MKEPLHLQYSDKDLIIRDESNYSLSPMDNARTYAVEYFLSGERVATNQVSVTVLDHDGTSHSCILSASGGGSTVHDRSALICENTLYVAVGSQLCALTLPTLSLLWNRKVDSATCFGVLYSAKHNCLISHGELEIARVELDGNVTWCQSGRDIFTGELSLEPEQIKVTDWNNDLYVLAISDGHFLVAPTP